MKDESEVSRFGAGRFRHPMDGLPLRPIMFCTLEMKQGNCRSNVSVLQLDCKDTDQVICELRERCVSSIWLKS